jgi:hypothetical protein
MKLLRKQGYNLRKITGEKSTKIPKKQSNLSRNSEPEKTTNIIQYQRNTASKLIQIPNKILKVCLPSRKEIPRENPIRQSLFGMLK